MSVKMYISRLNVLLYSILHSLFFVEKVVLVTVWIDIQIFNLVPLVLISVFMPISGCFQHCSSVVELKGKDYDAFRSSFIVQDCLAILFFFPY